MKTSHKSMEDAFVTRKDLHSIMEDAQILMEDSWMCFENYGGIEKDENWAFTKKRVKEPLKATFTK